MLRILHLSDLHFGPFFHEPAAEALLKQAHTFATDFIVISGDFTQRAKRDQFEAAREYLSKLPSVTTITVPGNHDVPLYRIVERVFTPYDLYREYISKDLDATYRGTGYTIVALNSTAPLRAITNGRISSAQLRYCAEVFSDADQDTLKIVVAHHHLAPAPDFERRELLPNAKRALKLFANLRVDLVLGGHLHRSYIGNSLDVLDGSEREHGVIIAQSGTSTSRRGRGREVEKNSFNVIELDGKEIRIMHYLYFNREDAFFPISVHRFARSSAFHLATL